MEPSVCFVCLSSADNYTHRDNGDSLYSKFLKLSQIYLGISTSLTKYNGEATFCANCESVVSSICQLHQELVAVQLHLSSKLGELGELMENSQSNENEWISCHSSSSVITSISRQLRVKNPVVVDTFRTYLKKKCERERSKALPTVLVEQIRSEKLPGTSELAETQLLPQTEEVGETSHFIKTEPPEESILPNFIDEVEHEEDNDEHSYFEAAPTCEEASATAYPLATSMKDKDKVFRCIRSRCNANFPTIHKLRQHTDSTHKPRSHVCPHCQNKFTTAKSMRKHILRFHSAQNNSSLALEPESSDSKSIPKRNRSNQNCKRATFGCPTCGNRYSSRGNLTNHVSRAHGKERFTCEKCNASFTCKQNLQVHFTARHNPQPHICSHCQSVFPTWSYLQRHINRMHPNINRPPNGLPNIKTEQFQDET